MLEFIKTFFFFATICFSKISETNWLRVRSHLGLPAVFSKLYSYPHNDYFFLFPAVMCFN